MTGLTILALLGLFYSLLYLTDTVLRTCPSTSTSYLLTLRRLGLEVSLLTVRWSTTRYNSTLHHLANLTPGLTRLWVHTDSGGCCEDSRSRLLSISRPQLRLQTAAC